MRSSLYTDTPCSLPVLNLLSYHIFIYNEEFTNLFVCVIVSTCHCKVMRISTLITPLAFLIISWQQLLTTLIYMAREGQK